MQIVEELVCEPTKPSKLVGACFEVNNVYCQLCNCHRSIFDLFLSPDSDTLVAFALLYPHMAHSPSINCFNSIFC